VRVAWVIHGDLDQRTGGYIYDRLVIEGLRAHGDEVIVLSEWEAGRPHRAEESDRIVAPIVEARVDTVIGDALWVEQLGPAFERLRGKAARVLLVHHLTSWEVECALPEALRAREKRAVMASDGLLATSSLTAGRIRVEYRDRAVDVVRPGADRLHRYPRVARPDGRVKLLFVGSLIARKNLLSLLDAMERLDDPRLSLTLIGDQTREPEHARILAARVALSPVLRPTVIALGTVDDDALARHMAQAQALVLSSSVEGYGMVLAEALRAGLPALVSRPSALASGLEMSEAVIVFDDTSDLVRALGRFVSDPALRLAMQRSAEAAVLPRWQETILRFREALLRITSPSARRASDRARVP
jgi:glycosyltransferase involved in cell wall biosynthesis